MVAAKKSITAWNKLDPSRTRLLRLKYMRMFAKRLKLIQVAVRNHVGVDDAYALGAPNTFQLARRQYQFLTKPQKLAQFRQWLTNQMQLSILAPYGGNPTKPWSAPFIESAYSKGLLRSYVQTHKADLAKSPAWLSGTREAFLRESFALPIVREKIEILATRSFNSMQGISQQIGSQLNRILADGMVRGEGPLAVARTMNKSIASINRARARVIARTEMVYAQAEGQLDGFARLGVTQVSAKVEWSTAGDALVCPDCDEMEGTVYTLDQAHGLIPLHPNCRCAWIPVV